MLSGPCGEESEMAVKIGTSLRGLVIVAGIVCSAYAVRADPPASLDAPAAATAGATVAVKWTGPGGFLDQIGAVPAGSPDNTGALGLPCYPGGSKDAHLRPAFVQLPEQPGEYELRYFMGGKVLARRKITVVAATARVQAPATATAGSRISVAWTGPNNRFDTIGIVKAGAPDKDPPVGGLPNFTDRRSPMTISVPEQAGDYEVRYLTGAGHTTLARTKLTVTGASASLTAPASVPAGTTFMVTWTGPAGEFDRIVISRKGSPDRESIDADFTSKGSPLGLGAPALTGDYELRYQTGASGAVLARAPLKVTPGKAEPGFVRVIRSSPGSGSASGPGAVEVILDASGSMRQRIGGQRRIDIAKRTLTKLTGETIPAGTQFALRVVGRGADTCQSELDIPLAPLDRAAVGLKLAALQAKSNARTPLGAALEKVADDLGSAQGERVVILVTDGEETCEGNPARTIAKLVRSGVDVRVNIVGFAIDDDKVVATFEAWSHAGGGHYFDARDAKSLSTAITQAVRSAFELTDARKTVVAKGLVGGDPVRLLPGTYAITLKGHPGPPRSVTVRPRETSTVSY